MARPSNSIALFLSSLKDLQYDELTPEEIYWRDHQPLLKEYGYELRPRYQPGWVASWKTNGKPVYDCEDAFGLEGLMDAVRSTDGRTVIFKRIQKSKHPREQEILAMFSKEPLASDPRNHCVPLQEVLQFPDDEDHVIFVMPFLRRVDDPDFVTFGEVIEFLRETFEGLCYMHEHNVAHRDITYLNLMMTPEPLYPQLYHPAMQYMTRDMSEFARHYTRTERPVKYYIIDFGFSKVYDPSLGPPLDIPTHAGDRTVPEYQDLSKPSDPFAVDVYCMGNVVRNLFTEGTVTGSAKAGFEFIEPLISDMTQDDPRKRPSMKDVVSRFESIQQGLSSWKLRSRLAARGEPFVLGFFRSTRHWIWQFSLIFRRIPPIPRP